MLRRRFLSLRSRFGVTTWKVSLGITGEFRFWFTMGTVVVVWWRLGMGDTGWMRA